MLELFQYHFFTNALLAAAFTSISCGIIGTYIVSRRIVFISGGISHASFGGVGIGYYLGINPIIGASVFAVFSAVAIESFSRNADLRKDSLIGMMWSLGMAIGIIFVFITPGYAANLMTYLFGNILTVSHFDIILMSASTLLVILVFYLLFKEILFISFDEEYAKTQGVPTSVINYILIGLVGLTIVINIRVVGIILVISLLTIPVITANLLTRNFKTMIFIAIGLGFLASLAGLFISYFFNIPSGATIIFTSILLFLVLKTYLLVSRNIKSRYILHTRN